MVNLLPIVITNFLLLPCFSYSQTIAGGSDHSLAVCSNNAAMTWGYNNRGQLGNGNNTNSNIPVQVMSISGVSAIAGGDGHSLALKNDNRLGLGIQ